MHVANVTAAHSCIHEAYPDVVLAGVGRVLIRVACLGVVVVAFTLLEPGPNDVRDTVVSGKTLVFHGKSSGRTKWLAVVRIMVIVALTGTLLSNRGQSCIPVL